MIYTGIYWRWKNEWNKWETILILLLLYQWPTKPVGDPVAKSIINETIGTCSESNLSIVYLKVLTGRRPQKDQQTSTEQNIAVHNSLAWFMITLGIKCLWFLYNHMFLKLSYNQIVIQKTRLTSKFIHFSRKMLLFW